MDCDTAGAQYSVSVSTVLHARRGPGEKQQIALAGISGRPSCVNVRGSNLFLKYEATAEGVANAQGLGGLRRRRWEGRALESLLIPSQTIYPQFLGLQ